MKVRIITFSVIAFLILGMVTVYAQGPGQRFRGWDEDDKFPELTSEQKDRMATLRADHMKTMIPKRAEMKLLRVEYREMMRNDASQSRLESKLDEIGTLRIEIQKIRLDHRLKMKAVLTDEQIQFLKDHPHFMKMLMKHHKGHGDRGERRFDGKRGFHGFGWNDDSDDMEFDDEGFYGCMHGGRGNCTANCLRL
jgi:Spy/CpxP family protein refolding chaperone